MCLAVPGRVVELLPMETPFATALVEFDGIQRKVNVACVPDALIGDYLMVHAGVAIARVDAEEAAQVLAALRALDLAEGDVPDTELDLLEIEDAGR
jgi:hydrogenase expression/formation protein HypC